MEVVVVTRVRMKCLCVACAMGSWADTWLGRERLGLGWGRASDGRLRGVGLLYVRVVDLWEGWTWAGCHNLFVRCSLGRLYTE